MGAIDVGSNAIRLLAVEFTDAGRWVELESQRLPIRLGHSAFLTGRLEEAAMAAAVEAMASFRRAFDTLGISRYRAVATSTVRESENGGELVRRVREESGIRLDTITGSEEARLVWLATRRRLDLGQRRWLLADVAGRGDLLLEQWAIRRKARMFRSTFDLEVELAPLTRGPALI